MQAINRATECLVMGVGTCYSFAWVMGESQGGGVKLTETDREDLIGGTVFLLLLAIALFLSCFL